ncbi:CvpA family protein [Rummeliibacillus stabekisii]|uniref:CvpA family protein n=1 Tax=Rummeliibacillus stabekisii TaxID=241244 RepID=UPI00371E5D62
MVDLIIIILLLAGLINGARKGFVLQLIQMAGFLVAVLVAYYYYKPLAEKLVLWIPYPSVSENSTLKFAVEQLNISQTFYQLLAFALIFFVVKFAIQIIASLFDFLRYIPVLGGLNRLLGGVLGFIEAYLLIFIVLYVFALLPLDRIQNYIEKSILTKLILEYTPIISKAFQHMWFVYMK